MNTPNKSRDCVIFVAIGLAWMGCGCAYVRPPAQDRAVWEQQQKPQLTDAERAGYEFVQGLWPVGWSP